MNDIQIIGRVGTTPRQRGSLSGDSCPDVLKLETGDYLVIGEAKWAHTEMNKLLDAYGASIGTDEMAVIVPADCMEAAALDIARSLDPTSSEGRA